MQSPDSDGDEIPAACLHCRTGQWNFCIELLIPSLPPDHLFTCVILVVTNLMAANGEPVLAACIALELSLVYYLCFTPCHIMPSAFTFLHEPLWICFCFYASSPIFLHILYMSCSTVASVCAVMGELTLGWYKLAESSIWVQAGSMLGKHGLAEVFQDALVWALCLCLRQILSSQKQSWPGRLCVFMENTIAGARRFQLYSKLSHSILTFLMFLLNRQIEMSGFSCSGMRSYYPHVTFKMHALSNTRISLLDQGWYVSCSLLPEITGEDGGGVMDLALASEMNELFIFSSAIHWFRASLWNHCQQPAHAYKTWRNG